MSAMRHQLHKATSANVSIPEIILLLLLARIAWHNRKDKHWLPPLYGVFLILYITRCAVCRVITRASASI